MDAVILVIDSFGIGELPDAEKYGDRGSNTALHICESINGEKWPVMKKMGLGNASGLLGNILPGCGPVKNPSAFFAAAAEKSPGKDTTTGHWEISGIVLDKPFKTFPPDFPSFPAELTDRFIKEVCSGYLGNKAASGTQIIQDLGDDHIKTGYPIIYTSSDSVLQIAAHEDIIPIDKLYEMCEKSRKICDDFMVGRVIARPFTGNSRDGFIRTENRRDFSIPLPGKTMLDILSEKGVKTIAVGKIGDIFNEQGIDESYHDKGNPLCIKRTEDLLKQKDTDDRLIFVNLVDTDMKYGHRRDIKGYFAAVSEIDSSLEKIVSLLSDNDVLIITADHGCDPSFRGTDHTREYVPLLLYRKGKTDSPETAGVMNNRGVRESFTDIAATVLKIFNCSSTIAGHSLI